MKCLNCGTENKFKKSGIKLLTGKRRYQQFQCLICGKICRSKKPL